MTPQTAIPSTASVASKAARTLDRLYAPISADMARVEEILREEMRNPHPFVDELVRYGCLLGGKRLRPALLLLTAHAVGNCTAVHHTLGAVLEMIHTATLVHDDVLDEAITRRHLATVNARWDNEASILLGDYLFSHAFYLAATTGHAEACRTIGRATNIVCEGEIRQKGSRGNFDLTEAAYYDIVDGKTAELTSCAGLLGAQYGGASKTIVESMTVYGRDLGIAFQIADDLLDLTGVERETGKSLGTDLDKQKPTLPIIHMLSKLGPIDKEAVIELLQAEASQRDNELQGWLKKTESLEYARNKALAYADSARNLASALPANPASEVLRELPNFVVGRSC